MLKISIFVCAILVIVVGEKIYNPKDYRNVFTCYYLPHTFWVHSSVKPAPICHTPLWMGLKENEKKYILKFHNDVRQKVARGEDKCGREGPQPPARIMRDLEWDEELADLAQRWANQCLFAYDQCRDVERFPIFQNVIRVEEPKNSRAQDIETALKRMHDYCEEYDGKDVEKYYPERLATNQTLAYVQMVGVKARRMGCGAIKFPIPPKNLARFLIVCNYGPTTENGQPVYHIFKK